MKNLNLYRHICEKLPDLGRVETFCVDVNSDDVYLVVENNVFRFRRATKDVKTILNIAEVSSTPSCSGIVGISHNALPDGNVICVASRGGDLITYDVDSEEVQCVGFVVNGLKAMQWSLDQETLILVTGIDTIIVMTSTFDPISEVNFHQENFGEKQFVNVGWGKKETQFHGSEGKAAALVGKREILPSINPDDGQPRVSWRDDGSLFAVSMIEPTTSLRCLRIFNREGILQYTSEMISGLEMTLAWRPSGNLIASTQMLPNKYQVIFFEKNGLHHGEFVLPSVPGEGRVHQLAWNVESDVLAVWYEDSKGSFLQLWTMSNYHWYMKQCLSFPEDQKLLAMQWENEAGLKLHIIFHGLQYSVLEWIWLTNHSYVHTPESEAFVGVIDGCNVLLSSFHDSVIPPPMCGEKLVLPVPVNQVVFGPTGLCTVLSDGTVALFIKEGNKHSLLRSGPVVWECDQPVFLPSPQLHHWVWIMENRLLCVCTLGETSYLVSVSLDDVGQLTARNIVDAGDVVLSIVPTTDCSGAMIQLQSRMLLLYNVEEEKLENYLEDVPQSYTQMEMCRVQDKDIVLGLTCNSRLYVQSVEIANNVTSLFVHPEFLLLTTSHHKLHCLRFTSEKLPELLSGRRIERGARLVIAVDTRVVLQMPRGNLECITPRPLVLQQAAVLLAAGNYRETMELLRKQRINLNLMVDHNPDRFLSDIQKFVEDIVDPSWLSLFLLELCDDDVTTTMYSDSYEQPRERPEFKPSKVQVVCDAVREAMQTSPRASSLHLPIIASYIQKRTDNDLAAALLEVKALSGDKATREEALNYILYIADVNDLYNIALGLYDFELVMMVAGKSNKDPKEYIPFLNELHLLEPNYQRYTIDNFLKRYSSALKHIALCPDHFDECLNLVKRHGLYKEALRLFPRASESYNKIAEAYADKLMSDRLFTEAAIMYQRCDQLPKALEACQSSADWREALIIMSKLGYSEDEFQDVCRKLASTLVQRRRYLEAAQLLSQHVNDTEDSIDILIMGHHWEEAIRVAYFDGRQDLVESRVRPEVLDHFDQIQLQVAKNSEQFALQRARLAVVRTTKHLRLEGEQYSGSGKCF
ncbi:elongator complex protein 1 isoform X2 [Anabrus simplex]|uniref:elongator complex protein 1 isoform X2 n=1 Tax=Anabrus simplex TaxID=316456 RepID=UPI0035A36D72